MLQLRTKMWMTKLAISISVLFTVGLFCHLHMIERGPLEMKRSKDFVVPNVVHFIRFGSLPLTFIDAVCILAALKHQKPKKVFIHSDQQDFKGGKYWEVVVRHPLAKGTIEVKYLEQPDTIFNMKLSSAYKLYHASDVERLRILMKYGGIYLDNDSYIVSSLNRYRKYEMTLGWEEGGGISNQVIIANRGARFLRVWLDSFRDYKGDHWFYNGGELPTKLLEKRPNLVHRVKHGLAEWVNTGQLIYLDKSESWRFHDVIHLLINHQYTIPQNLSETATYPVVFNETNILNYHANIRDMALDVYPFDKKAVRRQLHNSYKYLLWKKQLLKKKYSQ